MPRQQQRQFTVEKRGTNPADFRRVDKAPTDQVALTEQIDGMLTAIERLEQRVTAIADVLPDGVEVEDREKSGSTHPAGGVETDWGDIADELTQVIRTTEQATEDILDASEAIDGLAGEVLEALADELPNSEAAESVERIRGLTSQIFQAASFQDLTGQRISKVTKIVQSIDQRVGSLEKSLNGSTHHTDEKIAPASAAAAGGGGSLDPNDPHFNETSLLNGPSNEGISQEEIDQLF